MNSNPTQGMHIDKNRSQTEDNTVTVEEIPMDIARSPPNPQHGQKNPYKSPFTFNPSASFKALAAKDPQANFSLLRRQAQPKTSDQQENINAHFFQELKKLRENQMRLDEELLSLKLQNLQLNKMLHRTGEASQELYLTNLARSAMVAFDLSTSPAKVLSTNDTFCHLVGYQPNEIVGMPWQNFIHPDYIERTLELLFYGAADRKNNVVHMEQMYKTKDGAVFNAYDTHTIFFSNDRPATDVVFISLEPTPAHIRIRNAELEKMASNATSNLHAQPLLLDFNRSIPSSPVRTPGPPPPVSGSVQTHSATSSAHNSSSFAPSSNLGTHTPDFFPHTTSNSSTNTAPTPTKTTANRTPSENASQFSGPYGAQSHFAPHNPFPRVEEKNSSPPIQTGEDSPFSFDNWNNLLSKNSKAYSSPSRSSPYPRQSPSDQPDLKESDNAWGFWGDDTMLSDL